MPPTSDIQGRQKDFPLRKGPFLGRFPTFAQKLKRKKDKDPPIFVGVFFFKGEVKFQLGRGKGREITADNSVTLGLRKESARSSSVGGGLLKRKEGKA